MRPFLAASRFWQYLLAFVTIAVITAAFFGLRDALEKTIVALLYLIPLGCNKHSTKSNA